MSRCSIPATPSCRLPGQIRSRSVCRLASPRCRRRRRRARPRDRSRRSTAPWLARQDWSWPTRQRGMRREPRQLPPPRARPTPWRYSRRQRDQRVCAVQSGLPHPTRSGWLRDRRRVRRVSRVERAVRRSGESHQQRDWHDGGAVGHGGRCRYRERRAVEEQVRRQPERRAAASFAGSASPYIYAYYPATGTPLPIVRNEELMLVDAQIKLGLGQLAAAITLINDVHQGAGGFASPLAITPDYVDVRNALLKEQRISTILEGSEDRTIRSGCMAWRRCRTRRGMRRLVPMLPPWRAPRPRWARSRWICTRWSIRHPRPRPMEEGATIRKPARRKTLASGSTVCCMTTGAGCETCNQPPLSFRRRIIHGTSARTRRLVTRRAILRRECPHHRFLGDGGMRWL